MSRGRPVAKPIIGDGRSAPLVVLFRQSPVPRDSRAKKLALSLARAGYEVVIISCESQAVSPAHPLPPDPLLPPDPALTSESMLGPVRIVHLPVLRFHWKANQDRLIRNRRRRYPVLASITVTGRTVQIRGPQIRAKRSARKARAVGERRVVAASASTRARLTLRWVMLRLSSELHKREFQVMNTRNKAQARIDAAVRRGWKRYDERRVDETFGANVGRDLPEILDLTDALRPVLLQLQPDVLHVHHPFVLGVASEVQKLLNAEGHRSLVVYDSRENFGGLPALEKGSVRRHHVLLDQERRYIRGCAGVSTVSEPIADVLKDRYQLPRRPTVILNTPVLGGRTDGPTVRDVIGLPSGVPLMVYSGVISHARGIDTLVRGLAFMPKVHLVIVAVPFPHPSVPELLVLAEEVGALDRIHVVPPVDQGHLVHYLSGADLAVHPMPGGSPNHDQALPNKLFEYVHAGLPIVVSGARLMADFVTSNNLGGVFVAGDPRSFSDAVVRVLDSAAGDPERLAALAREFCWQGQEKDIVDYYNSLTGYQGRVPEGLDFPSLEITKETAS